MVRLVFRPYTQIWRSICTSESLRASTRVSPGFTLLRHSSPSFGSQHVCSHSDLSPEGYWPADCAPEGSNHCYFHCARRFATFVLAHMLDSLVRVSRRGKENHFVLLSQNRRQQTRSTPSKLFRKFQPSKTKARHSAQAASGQGSMTEPTLVSFASLSAISGTL